MCRLQSTNNHITSVYVYCMCVVMQLDQLWLNVDNIYVLMRISGTMKRIIGKAFKNRRIE